MGLQGLRLILESLSLERLAFNHITHQRAHDISFRPLSVLYFFLSLALCFVLHSVPCLPNNNQMSAVSAAGRTFPHWLVQRGNSPPMPWIIVTSSFVSSLHEVMPLTHNATFCCGLGTKGNMVWPLEVLPTTVTHLAEDASEWNQKVGEKFVKCHRLVCVDQWDYFGPWILALWTASISVRQLD